MVWVFDTLELTDGKYRIKTKIKRVDGVQNIKNNIYTFLNWNDYFMGLKYNIIYDDSMFTSVLTGWRYSSEGRFIQLRFGNVRSRFSELLD